MKINLQWLAYPVWAYSLYCLMWVLIAIPGLFKTEIYPLIAFAAIYHYGSYAIFSSIIGGLVYMAFRNIKLSIGAEKEEK